MINNTAKGGIASHDGSMPKGSDIISGISEEKGNWIGFTVAETPVFDEIEVAGEVKDMSALNGMLNQGFVYIDNFTKIKLTSGIIIMHRGI